MSLFGASRHPGKATLARLARAGHGDRRLCRGRLAGSARRIKALDAAQAAGQAGARPAPPPKPWPRQRGSGTTNSELNGILVRPYGWASRSRGDARPATGSHVAEIPHTSTRRQGARPAYFAALASVVKVIALTTHGSGTKALERRCVQPRPGRRINKEALRSGSFILARDGPALHAGNGGGKGPAGAA